MTEENIIKNGLKMDINRQDFALELKTWRLRNGLTQLQVANKFGCSRFTIMRAEQAKTITWEMAYRLFMNLLQELKNENKA